MARPRTSVSYHLEAAPWRQTASGLSIPELCLREEVSSVWFYAWRRRLAAPQTASPPDPPLFVPIRLNPAPAAAGHGLGRGFEIELPDHIWLRAPRTGNPRHANGRSIAGHGSHPSITRRTPPRPSGGGATTRVTEMFDPGTPRSDQPMAPDEAPERPCEKRWTFSRRRLRFFSAGLLPLA